MVLKRKEDLHLNRPGIAASKEQPFLPPLLTSPQASQIPSSLGEVQLSLISEVTAEILRGRLHRTCVSPCWASFFFSFNSNCKEEILRSDSPTMTTAHALVCPDQSHLGTSLYRNSETVKTLRRRGWGFVSPLRAVCH